MLPMKTTAMKIMGSLVETIKNGCPTGPKSVGKKTIRKFSFLIILSLVFLTAFTLSRSNGEKSVCDVIYIKTKIEAAVTTTQKNTSNIVSQQQKETKSSSPYEWRVQQHATQTRKELSILEDQLGDRYVSWLWGVDNKGLTFKSFEKKIIPILRHRGLILIGDSTTRHLFGFLYCLLEGAFRDDGMDHLSGPGRCRIVQNQLKQGCQFAQQCGQIAKFTRQDYNKNLHLEFRPGNSLRSLEEDTFNYLRNQSLDQHIPQRIIYIGMPCLHSLWTPGSREIRLNFGISDWPGLFDHFYSQVQEAIGSAKVLYGMSNSVCDSNLGDNKQIIEAYLKETRIDGATEMGQRIIDYYNYNLTQAGGRLPPNHNGTIPAYQSFRFNHTSEDFALLHDSGSLECSKTGMAALLGRKKVASDKSYVLDMRSATSHGCNLTGDGIHYRGDVLLQQTALIVKGVRRAFGGGVA